MTIGQALGYYSLATISLAAIWIFRGLFTYDKRRRDDLENQQRLDAYIDAINRQKEQSHEQTIASPDGKHPDGYDIGDGYGHPASFGHELSQGARSRLNAKPNANPVASDNKPSEGKEQC